MKARFQPQVAAILNKTTQESMWLRFATVVLVQPDQPAPPTLGAAGTPGTTSYTYALILSNINGDSVQSPSTTITTGNATLGVSNYNTISWPALLAGQTMTILRTASGGTPSSTGQIATGLTGTSFNDTGFAASTYSAAINGLTVNLSDGSVAVQAKYDAAYSPKVGDYVFGIQNGTDLVIMGKLAQSPGGGGRVTPGQVIGATPGGPNIPSSVTITSTSSTTDRIAQANNASITVNWNSNPTNENVTSYDLRWKKSIDTVYSSERIPGVATGNVPLSYVLRGLIPGQIYNLSLQAVNNIGGGVAGGYPADINVTAATDAVAPAVPTGLAAIKTPRGAQVTWNQNTEADLQGYVLQVSLNGGAYGNVAPGPILSTGFTYFATSGTALGSTVQFQIAAIDWSGNQSAFSAATGSIGTDGVVMDELIAGNLKVAGVITTGSLATASSGARSLLDSAGLHVNDGTRDRVLAGNLGGSTYGIQNFDSLGNLIFDSAGLRAVMVLAASTISFPTTGKVSPTTIVSLSFSLSRAQTLFVASLMTYTSVNSPELGLRLDTTAPSQGYFKYPGTTGSSPFLYANLVLIDVFASVAAGSHTMDLYLNGGGTLTPVNGKLFVFSMGQ